MPRASKKGGSTMNVYPSATGRALWLLAAGMAVGVLAAPAARALSPELQCQDTIAKTARNYFKKHYTAVSKCENKRAKGSVPSTVECRQRVCVGGDRDSFGCASDVDCPGGACQTNPGLDTKTGKSLATAAAKVQTKLAAKCSDPLPSGVRLGVPCGTSATLTVADVAGCIVNQAHGVNAERLLSTVYDETGAITDEGVRRCQEKIAKESRNYSKKRETRRRGCAKKLADGKIQGPCPDAKTRAAMDKDLVKFRDKVLAACSATQVLDPSKDFGFPCERNGATNFSHLTFDRNDAGLTSDIKAFRCVAAVAAGDADAGSAMAYPMFDAAPFSYGVAAGDPTPTGFMAWTRADSPADVTLDVATDEGFATIVFTMTASPNALGDNTVKIDATGLSPATQYFYRFTQGMAVSRVGRVKTAPLASSPDPVRFVWTGDSNAFFKPYTVLDPMLGDDPDVWLYIGDTIYGDDARSGTGVAVTRDDYHTKYKENRDDASLRNVLASFGTVAQWDDHEVTNDFYGTNMAPGFQAQMTAGNEAFRDYMPFRDDAGDALQLYRSFQWGQAAEFFVIDARQYRDPQAYVTEPACLSMGEPVVLPAGTCAAEINNPSRTYLGATQKQWLKDGLLNSTATFKFVMNGPLISSLIYLPYDRWDGYTAERTEMIDYVKNNDIRNVVFLSTDIHALIVNSQVGNAMDPIIQEWVSGAIGMDPIYRELPATIAPLVPQLPILFMTIDYFDIDRFNYGLIEVSTTQATVTYRDATGAVLKQFTVPAT
jgi:alkaline phosphatase D